MDATGDLFLVSAGSGSVYEVPGPTFPVAGSLTRLTPNLGTPLTNIDGARCQGSLATVNSPLGCTPNRAYLVDTDGGYTGTDCGGMNGHSHLTTYDINSGATTTSAQLLQDFNGPRTTINNLGYNTTDNYLWGFRFGTNQLVRIGAGNAVDLFAIEGLPDQCPTGTQTDPENNFFNAGDVSPDGIMYLFNGLDGTQLFRVDINPSSPNYLQLLPTLSLSLSPGAGTLTDVPDLAINPVDNLLYSVSASQNLIRFDVATGTVTNLGPVSGLAPLVAPNAYVAQYFDVSGNLYIQSSNSDDLYRIADVAGGGRAATLYDGTSVTLTSGGDAARCSLSPIGQLTISGNVFHDANGNIAVDPGESTGPASSMLSAYLVDANGNIVDVAAIAPDGSYSFPAALANTSYSIVLSTATGITPGSPAPAPALPDGWINTGELYGANNNAGSGSESVTPGVISVTTATSNITGADFGIEQLPQSDDHSHTLATQPAPNTVIALNGISAPSLSGSDPEDFAAGGSLDGRTIQITSLPTNGELWYNGVQITLGGDGVNPVSTNNPFTISGVDLSKLEIKLTGLGYTSTSFTYAFVDQAGAADPTPATYTISWESPLPVRLISFEAKPVERYVLLSWSTAQESNSDFFQVQRSDNAKDWHAIGEQKSNGESQSIKHYSFTDLEPSERTKFYRLQMVDLDGTFAYSSIRVIDRSAGSSTAYIYPNPAFDVIRLHQVDVSKVSRVLIADLSGVVVYRHSKINSDHIKLPSLTNGMYIMQLTLVDGSTSSHKFVVNTTK